VGLVAICNPLFTKYTPLVCFFIDFFPKCCGTLRIMQRHLFSFWNVAKFYGLRNNARFPSGMLQNFTDYAMMLVSRVPKGANKVQGPTASTPGQN